MVRLRIPYEVFNITLFEGSLESNVFNVVSHVKNYILVHKIVLNIAPIFGGG